MEEHARLQALASYRVLDQGPISELERVVRIAAALAGTAVAEINLIDAERQWQAASHGHARGWAPRRSAICPYVVEHEAPLYLPDAREDERFAGNPHVDGRLASLRLYFSHPLTSPEGMVIGTLCVWDSEPGELSEDQRARLDDLSFLVMHLLDARRAALMLGEAALHDPLTGAANRVLVLDRLTQARARDERVPGETLVAMIDLTGFKEVNDRWGHDVGDGVLVAVVDRLQDAVRPQDTVGRWGGDEFVVVVGDGPMPTSADELEQRLHASLSEPVDVAGRRVSVRASIGVARGRASATSEGVLKLADEQMYSRKLSLPRQREVQHPPWAPAPID